MVQAGRLSVRVTLDSQSQLLQIEAEATGATDKKTTVFVLERGFNVGQGVKPAD